MTSLLQDGRYALRQLRQSPGFAAIAVVTVALGIGATTAMFSVVNAILLRPLPFQEPERLMAIGEYDTRLGQAGKVLDTVSYADLRDIRTRNRSFSDVAAYNWDETTLTGVGEPLHVKFGRVNAGMFRLLGVNPVLGRDFRSEEDQPGHHVAVVSDQFWRSRLNADPNALGRSLSLGGRAYTVVGVMPAGFQFPVASEGRDFWLTFSRNSEIDDPGDTPMTEQRGNHTLQAIGRLRPGITLPQANADLAAIASALAKEYPGTNAYGGIAAQQELEFLVGDTRTPLVMLLAAVGLVLLIACANVANLLLLRSSARVREIGVRAALGATRARLIRQLVTESTILSLGGALLGIGVASAMLRGVLHFYPENLPRVEQIAIDPRVLGFSAVLAVVTGILFGLAPAVQASSPNLAATMREGGRTTTTGVGASRLRSALVIGEVALGVMLLVGAGLLLRSLQRLAHVELGFKPDHLITASFDLSEARYKPDQMDQFIREFLSRLKSLPGVTAASGAMPLPLSDSTWHISFNWPDHPVKDEDEPGAAVYLASPGLFEAMHIPLLRGRTFSGLDHRNGEPTVIINRAFAKKFFPNQDPIGRKIKMGGGEGPARERYKTREIVGIVGDIRNRDLENEPEPAYYVPLPQLMWGTPTLVVRTTGDPSAMAGEIRKVLLSMDSEVPLYAIRTMDDYFALNLGRARFQALLLSLFAGIALVLTAVGLYGVMAQAVAQRTHEIGVRMAMGASRESVRSMILRRGTELTLAGTAVGIVGALALARLIESLLYQIPPRDPLTYVGVCAVLSAVALAASYVPALRATKVDPMVALRYE
jgi:putative ABC transport system permease protein